MESDELTRYAEVRKSVARRRSMQTFVAHLGMYLVCNAFFGGWNALTYYVTETGFILVPPSPALLGNWSDNPLLEQYHPVRQVVGAR